MTRGRLEAFSDGVIAIAITLLVLDLRVPARDGLDGRSLVSALGDEWPSFAAYVVSFTVIGIMWVNHHVLLNRFRTVDRRLVLANLFLLGAIAALPFTTALMAEYVDAGGTDARVAAAVYSGSMFVASIGFTLVASQLLHGRALVRFSAGLVLYAATIGLAFVSAPLTLAVHAALAVYYAFDQLRTDDAGREPGEASPLH